MKTLALFALLLSSMSVQALERKPMLEVDVNALTTEAQATRSSSNGLDLVWWIPVEFWEAILAQNPDVPKAQAEQMIGVLQSNSVLGVVQADISPFGAFHFYDKERVMNGITIELIDEAGNAETISHTEPANADVRLLLDQMRPILTQAMGNMGENFYFFPLPAFNDDDERVPSPYESGRLQVTLSRDEANVGLEVALPIDALFVPRVCPNGKPAHVSWDYCPWSGSRLSD